MMNVNRDLGQSVVVRLSVGDPSLPFCNEKDVEIDREVWDQLDPQGRAEYLDDEVAKYATEVYYTGWEILSDHDINVPALRE